MSRRILTAAAILALVSGATMGQPASAPHDLFDEVAGVVSVPAAGSEAGQDRFGEAERTYDALSAMDKVTLALTVVAAGDYDGPVPPKFTRPLFEAIRKFQRESGMSVDGVPDPATRAALNRVGGSALGSWGMTFADHPTASGSIWIPSRMNLTRTAAPDGLKWETPDGTVEIDFAFKPGSPSGFAALYGKVSSSGTVDMRVIKEDVFAVSGRTPTGRRFYARYLRTRGGAVGFRMSWNDGERPDCRQLSILMANGLSRTRREHD